MEPTGDIMGLNRERGMQRAAFTALIHLLDTRLDIHFFI